MKFAISFLSALFLVACDECVSWKVEHSAITNPGTAPLSLIVCDKAKPTERRREITVKENSLYDIEWFAERAYDRFRVGGSCDDSNNSSTPIELAIAASSQATTKLCEHADVFKYRIVPAADPCPTDYSEVTDNCP